MIQHEDSSHAWCLASGRSDGFSICMKHESDEECLSLSGSVLHQFVS
jgi:hypothetical protein